MTRLPILIHDQPRRGGKLKDWKKIVGSLAPVLATALGGPLAGTATKYVSQAILGRQDGSEDEIEAALLMATPEQLANIKEIEAKFKVDMRKLDIDLEAIAVDDRKSARNMASTTSLWPQATLSAIFIGGFLSLLWVLFSGAISLDESVKDIALIMLGVLASGVTVILKFWFGGSPNDGTQMEKIYNSVPR